MSSKKRLEVDRRVGIALSALSSSQREAVDRVLHSPQRFATHVASSADVRLVKDGEPRLYCLRVTPNLRLFYEEGDEGFRVVDLVDRATLKRFSPTWAEKAPAGGAAGRSKAVKKKVGELANHEDS
ncbi:hypothetical protein [Paludisphaera borealis]|uniref:Uncharacterized protein n=1 Tax=Paludisphaera borealis TaxID=1387353 RepID=A0A1U7CTC2_9BACT|nr:hypothetical protein [Paludisphaera borealis]APW62146.1 hypothetical protein BSF38_03678 [Paludisphaera borealis]